MTKHQPKHPIPWEAFCGEEAFNDCTVCSNKPYMEVCDAYNFQDASYIVHAANAYPKLVEALREMLLHYERILDAVQDKYGLEARAGLAAKEIILRNIIADLGED